MDNILMNNYENILINEASKLFLFFDTERTNENNRILYLKGLIQYINYQGLYHEDIRKINYYIKRDYGKKSSIYKKFHIDTSTVFNEDEYKMLDNRGTMYLSNSA